MTDNPADTLNTMVLEASDLLKKFERFDRHMTLESARRSLESCIACLRAARDGHDPRFDWQPQIRDIRVNDHGRVLGTYALSVWLNGHPTCVFEWYRCKAPTRTDHRCMSCGRNIPSGSMPFHCPDPRPVAERNCSYVPSSWRICETCAAGTVPAKENPLGI